MRRGKREKLIQQGREEVAAKVETDLRPLIEDSVQTGKEALAIANRSMTLLVGTVALAEVFKERAGNPSATDVLGAQELAVLAERIPQWEVSYGTEDGKVFKRYTRTISEHEIPEDRRVGGPKERETYLSLTDAEHSDIGLAQIFDTYSFTGSYINGNHYVITINANEAGPITFGDLSQVLDAECYLVEQAYVIPHSPELDTV